MMEHTKKQTVLITGAGGYLGSEIIKKLKDHPHIEKIIGLDIRGENTLSQTYDFFQGDIRDKNLGDQLQHYSIDVIIHLASIVTPGPDSSRSFEYSVDVLGTQNILELAIKHKIPKVIISSSGAAYGYYPDNPTWITEKDPLRGNPEFAYSDHKRIVEEMLEDYREKYPELKQLIFRPGVIIGEKTQNQITDLFKKKFILGIWGQKSRFNFIWDQDVANCFIQGIFSPMTGAYNLAGNGALSLKQIAKVLHKPYLPLPQFLIKGALFIGKKLKLTQYGPEQTIFLAYRPVLDNHKLKKTFGFTPQKTSHEAFLMAPF